MIIAKENLKLAYPECAGKFITYPCFCEAKLDGEMGIFTNGKIYGKGGKSRRDFFASSAATIIAKELGCTYLFGELHFGQGWAGDLYKLLGNYNNDHLYFGIFDFDSDKTYIERREMLLGSAVLSSSVYCFLVPARYCTNKEEADEAYELFIGLGYEGVIYKAANAKLSLGHNAWVKRKKKETADLLVVSADGFKERVGLGIVPGVELCGCKVPGICGAERADMVGKIMEVEFLQKLFDEKGNLTGLRNPVYKMMRPDKTEISLK